MASVDPLIISAVRPFQMPSWADAQVQGFKLRDLGRTEDAARAALVEEDLKRKALDWGTDHQTGTVDYGKAAQWAAQYGQRPDLADQLQQEAVKRAKEAAGPLPEYGDANGVIYNKHTGQPSWTPPPKEAPDEWALDTNSDGQRIWYNKRTRATQLAGYGAPQSAPATLDTGAGIMQWRGGKWEPTGFRKPAPATGGAAPGPLKQDPVTGKWFRAKEGMTTSVPSTQKFVSPAARNAATNALSGLDAVDQISTMIDKGLSSGEKFKARLPFGAFDEQAQMYRTAATEASDVLARLRTGAAINANEERLYRSYIPGATDHPKVAAAKLARLRKVFARIASTDPTTGVLLDGTRTTPTAPDFSTMSDDELLDQIRGGQ